MNWITGIRSRRTGQIAASEGTASSGGVGTAVCGIDGGDASSIGTQRQCFDLRIFFSTAVGDDRSVSMGVFCPVFSLRYDGMAV